MAESNIRIKRKGYTVIFRNVAQDMRLSLKTRGLFLFMMSLPRDFTISESRLVKFTGAGRTQIRAALKELKEVGYLVVEQSHGNGGKFAQSVYVLQEEAPGTPPPLFQNVTAAEPQNATVVTKTDSGKTDSGKRDQLNNTISTNTPLPPQGEQVSVSEKASTTDAAPKWNPERFDAFWTFYKSHSAGRRVGSRRAAARAWDKLRPDDDTIAAMGRCLVLQSGDDMWRRGVGVPYASTWINSRTWEEDDAPTDNPPEPGQEVTGWRT